MSFEPAGTNGNAILEVAFVIDFEKDFSQEELDWIDSKRDIWIRILPRRIIEPILDNIPPPFFPNKIENNQSIGLSYQYLNPDGSIRHSLNVERNRIVYFVSEYTKWHEVWPPINGILEPIYNYLSSRMNVLSFSTEYLNLFVYSGKYLSVDLSKLIRENNGITPAEITERKLNWHLHTGFFGEENEPVPHRSLTRVNFDLRDRKYSNKRELILLLFQSLRPQNKESIPTSIYLHEEIKSLGLENFSTLHDKVRQVLKQLICDEMLNQIGFE